MKRIITYSSIGIPIMVLMQCYMGKTVFFEPFQRQNIDSITIQKQDTSGYKTLSASQIDKLITEVNESKSVGLYKAMYEFKLRVYSHGDTSYREITSFGSKFKFKKECGDYTFQVKDTSLFRELWKSN